MEKEMERKKRVYQAITITWNLMKDTGFHVLSDDEWENLIETFRKGDMEESIEKDFFVKLSVLVTSYYESLGKEEKEEKKKIA